MEKHSMDNQILVEEAKREFLVELERCEGEGSVPSLPDFVRRYPAVAPELIAWATTFMIHYEAMPQDTELASASEETLAVIHRVHSALREEPKDLNAAREALGWSQFTFAERLRLSPTITRGLGRGEGRQWPKALEEMLANVLARPLVDITSLLARSVAVPAQHFKATGDPSGQPYKSKSFRELLEEADRKGEMDPDDKQFWLDALESEEK